MTAIDILALVYAALQLADMATTIIALRKGGRERNRIIVWFMDRFGPPGLWVAKALAAGAGYWIWASQPPGALAGLAALCALYTFVVISNARKI